MWYIGLILSTAAVLPVSVSLDSEIVACKMTDNTVIMTPPHYIILDLLLKSPIFTGFHKVHAEQMQAGTTSSASSGEKWVRQSQRPVASE